MYWHIVTRGFYEVDQETGTLLTMIRKPCKYHFTESEQGRGRIIDEEGEGQTEAEA
jgi:hypothetical protein